MENIPETLKAARRTAGVTQAKADRLCGLGKGQFAAWESGRNVPLDVTVEGVLTRLQAFKKHPLPEMTESEIIELIESVNRRRTDGSVSPVHTPAAHAQLVEDVNKLIAAGYELGDRDEWHKVR